VPARGPACVAVLRTSRWPIRDVVLVRPQWRTPGPPPLQRAPALPAPALGEDAAAAGRCMLPPIERALTAAALLRLTLAPAATTALRELGLLERALADAERRVRALAGRAGDGARSERFDLGALVAGLVSGLPGRVRAEVAAAPALVRGDAVRVRAALREVLVTMVAAGPEGLRAAVRAGGALDAPTPEDAVVELSAPAGLGDEAIDVARALLGPEGARIALVTSPGSGAERGQACRITFAGVGRGEPRRASPGAPGRDAEALTPGRAGQ